MADRGDRLAALGNGQVPRVVAEAWRCLTANAGVERHAPETYCGSEEAGVRVSDRTTC
jgi:hypothetical protein